MVYALSNVQCYHELSAHVVKHNVWHAVETFMTVSFDAQRILDQCYLSFAKVSATWHAIDSAFIPVDCLINWSGPVCDQSTVVAEPAAPPSTSAAPTTAQLQHDDAVDYFLLGIVVTTGHRIDAATVYIWAGAQLDYGGRRRARAAHVCAGMGW